MEEFKFIFNALFNELNLIPDLYQYYQPKYSLDSNPITIDNFMEYIKVLYDKHYISFYYYTADYENFMVKFDMSIEQTHLTYKNGIWVYMHSYTYNFLSKSCDCVTFQSTNTDELLDIMLKDYKIPSYYL